MNKTKKQLEQEVQDLKDEVLFLRGLVTTMAKNNTLDQVSPTSPSYMPYNYKIDPGLVRWTEVICSNNIV